MSTTGTHSKEFVRIDKLIAIYYQQQNVDNYFLNNQNGKFLQYIIDEELDDHDLPIEHELGLDCKPHNTTYTQFDDEFPIDDSIKNICDDIELIIFYIIQFIWKYNQIPSNKYLEDKIMKHYATHHDVSNCSHLLRLIKFMNEYSECKHDDINIYDILNDHLHVMMHHDSNEEFEYVYNKLIHCDITKCSGFKRRSYRHRNMHLNTDNDNNELDDEKRNKEDTKDVVYTQIIDNIHCYYNHCFDIGNKLLLKEQMMLNQSDDVHNGEDQLFSEIILNEKLVKMNQILSSKREMYQTIYDKSNRSNKYNQLCVNKHKQSPDNIKAETVKSNNKLYSFGFVFYYGTQWRHVHHDKSSGESVKAKYSSLKDELITNNICALSIEQFTAEYQKCLIHYGSEYCKQTFPKSLSLFLHEHDEKHYAVRDTGMLSMDSFQFEYLFSLMIYCNFTSLQCEFSKTYREDNGSKHNEYYHLGNCIKRAVHIFGTPILFGNIKAFYHGINQ
eukprot:517611_1